MILLIWWYMYHTFISICLMNREQIYIISFKFITIKYLLNYHNVFKCLFSTYHNDRHRYCAYIGEQNGHGILSHGAHKLQSSGERKSTYMQTNTYIITMSDKCDNGKEQIEKNRIDDLLK